MIGPECHKAFDEPAIGNRRALQTRQRFGAMRKHYTRMLAVLQKEGHRSPRYLELQKKISASLMQIRFSARMVEKLCDNICLIHNGHLVLSGAMREIKSRYPNNRVHMTFEGDASFLNHPSIEEVKNYSGRAEIKLRDGDNGQALLAEAVTKARITRFEVMEPTLEEIFIEKVTASSIANNGGGKVDA